MFYRSCDDCKKFIYDARGLVKGADGKAVKRPETLPLDCTLCKKHDIATNYTWRKFTVRNEYIFRCFMVCKCFNALPRPGGVDQQDPELMDTFVLLSQIFDRSKDLENKDFQAKIMGAALGVK